MTSTTATRQPLRIKTFKSSLLGIYRSYNIPASMWSGFILKDKSNSVLRQS